MFSNQGLCHETERNVRGTLRRGRYRSPEAPVSVYSTFRPCEASDSDGRSEVLRSRSAIERNKDAAQVAGRMRNDLRGVVLALRVSVHTIRCRHAHASGSVLSFF